MFQAGAGFCHFERHNERHNGGIVWALRGSFFAFGIGIQSLEDRLPLGSFLRGCRVKRL